MIGSYHGTRPQRRTSGGDGEQVTSKRVRKRSDSDQPGCGGLEPDQRLAKDIDRGRLLETAIEFGGAGTVLGLDIAKQEIACCLRWGQGRFERPWKVVNPQELDLLVQWCEFLRSRCDGFTVGMELTGTYGDGIRYALSKAGINLQRVSGKAVSDYQEIFDGVPSQQLPLKGT